MSAMSGETETSYGSAPGKWSAYMRDLFRTRQPPPLGSVDPDKIEAAAREKLKDSPGESYAYARTAIPAFHSESRVSPPGPAIVPRWVDASSCMGARGWRHALKDSAHNRAYLQVPSTSSSDTQALARRTARTGARSQSGRLFRECCATPRTAISRYALPLLEPICDRTIA